MANETERFIEHFHEIDLKKPVDIIIQQIKDLISSRVLKPGNRLPSERALVERFGVGRGHIREAIKKLEFYGILKTLPQSGTIVASLGVKALEGLISNVLNLEKEDFESLMETRGFLEVHAARLAAMRASNAEVDEIAKTHNEFRRQVENENPGLEEDLLFHLKIAECSKNSVLGSLISLITPDIITLSRDLNTCRNGRFLLALKEHESILEGIQRRKPEKAAEAMAEHIRISQLQYKSRKILKKGN
jgi:GntR family transcriptional repressor for pyruvate dehydrogenase complex